MSAGAGSPTVGRAYIGLARKHLSDKIGRIEHCVAQLDDEQVWWRPHESMNSVGNIVLHLCGNLRQWVVSGVGGVPDTRDRPAEFAERGPLAKGELIRRLEAVVAEADAAVVGLDESRLLEPRRIQGFDETVLSAIWGALEHLGGHAQEVVYITRLRLGDRYRFAWTPTTPEQGAGPGTPTATSEAAIDDLTQAICIGPENARDYLHRADARSAIEDFGAAGWDDEGGGRDG